MPLLRSTRKFPAQIRPFDAKRDLLQVADLIELCFADTLNSEGLSYIQQMRRAAQDRHRLYSTWSTGYFSAIPPFGFVWEQEEKIIGNLSIIPFHTSRGFAYLIANVAVHPEFRRRGIAQALTERALAYIHERGEKTAWLHVRDDNPAAIQLYRKLGFQERMRRTSWIYPPPGNDHQQPSLQTAPFFHLENELTIQPRHSADWKSQSIWLGKDYPDQFSDHLAINKTCLVPGIIGWLASSWNNTYFQHWSAYHRQQLAGVASLEVTHQKKYTLWLALNPQYESEAAYALLTHLMRNRHSQRQISLDYPAYRAEEAIRAAGFYSEQTLIWMSRSTVIDPTQSSPFWTSS